MTDFYQKIRLYTDSSNGKFHGKFHCNFLLSSATLLSSASLFFGATTSLLNFLDNNITAYMEYHDWRTLIPNIPKLNSSFIGFDNLASQEKDFCLLCRLIREKEDLHSQIKNTSR